MRNFFYSLILVFSFVLVTAVFAWAEEVKIRAYFPSPQGEYNTITTTSNTLLASDGAGKVGIGVTGGTPAEKLDIHGDVRVKSGALEADGGLRIETTASDINKDPLHMTEAAYTSCDNSAGASLVPVTNNDVGRIWLCKDVCGNEAGTLIACP